MRKELALQTVEKLPETEGTPEVSKKKPDPEIVARLVIREGKPFYWSALQGGYAQTVAKNGLKEWLRNSQRCAEAFQRESQRMATRLDTLKPHAVNRLFHEIIDLESGANGLRAIELAGKFKETDWFVRSTELNLGVFVGLSESNAGENTPPDDTKE